MDENKTSDGVTIMTKNKFEVAILKEGIFLHVVPMFDYPLNNFEDLRKYYSEARGEELERIK